MEAGFRTEKMRRWYIDSNNKKRSEECIFSDGEIKFKGDEICVLFSKYDHFNQPFLPYQRKQ